MRRTSSGVLMGLVWLSGVEIDGICVTIAFIEARNWKSLR
jgi:hypothetical protein